VSVWSSPLVYICVRLIFPFVLLEWCFSILYYIYLSVWSHLLVYIFVRLLFPLCFSGVMLFNLIVYIFVHLIFPLSIYMCPSDLPLGFSWVMLFNRMVYICVLLIFLLVYMCVRLIFPLSICTLYVSVWSSLLVYIGVRLIFPFCFSGGLFFNLIVYMCSSDRPP
jgi:hypothetical protein